MLNTIKIETNEAERAETHKQLIEELMDLVDAVITEDTLDGEGIPYYNEPDGVYEPRSSSKRKR